ncbi:MAG: hypothetical protein HY261_09340, partial [Chloroflexi bacterium]|nr:hypothetical protein [Chloroflexota bacterium]
MAVGCGAGVAVGTGLGVRVGVVVGIVVGVAVGAGGDGLGGVAVAVGSVTAVGVLSGVAVKVAVGVAAVVGATCVGTEGGVGEGTGRAVAVALEETVGTEVKRCVSVNCDPCAGMVVVRMDGAGRAPPPHAVSMNRARQPSASTAAEIRDNDLSALSLGSLSAIRLELRPRKPCQ